MKSDYKFNKSIFNNIKYLFGIPFGLGVLIALLAPVDVLKYSFFQIINDVASYIFPSVRKMKGEYELGQVAKLYFSVVWLMSPFLFVGGYREMQRQAEKIVARCKEKKILFFFFFFMFLPAVAILMTSVTFENNDLDDFRSFLTFHSRWGMPVWGFLIPAGASVMYAMAVFGVRNFTRLFD